jgi:putative PIN family toxin of toxin-antitoxin system
MKIVLDTNVLLTSISERSSIHSIFVGFLDEGYELCVTTDILIEYEEIITRHLGVNVASAVLQAIENAPNVLWITRYYFWRLIENDPDDNKFVDCAIAANATYIVSEDRHFNVLQHIPYPKVNVIKAKTFQQVLEQKDEA